MSNAKTCNTGFAGDADGFWLPSLAESVAVRKSAICAVPNGRSPA